MFDGERCPSKKEEGAKCDQAQKEAEEGINLLKQVDNRDDTGRENFKRLARKAMGFSELYTSIFIQVCKEFCVEFVGAPFQADFQLAEEQRSRIKEGELYPFILTSESNLLVPG